VWREIRKLLHNREYLIILWCFGWGLAYFNSLLTVLGQLIEPCGYSEDDAGNLGAIFLGAGLIGAVVMGAVMDATHAYRPILKTGYLFAFGAVVFYLWAQQPDRFYLMAISSGILGAAMLPLLPVSIENAVECTFPIPEVYSSGLLLGAGNTIGIGVTFAMTKLIEMDGGHCGSFSKPTNVFTLVLMALAAFPILTYWGQYLRLKAEAESSVLYGVQAPPGTAAPLLSFGREVDNSRGRAYQDKPPGVEAAGYVTASSRQTSMEASV